MTMTIQNAPPAARALHNEQSPTKGLGFVNGLVEMSEDVVEGISAGDVDVAGLESRAVFGGTDGNAGSDRRAGLRLSVNRLRRGTETGQGE